MAGTQLEPPSERPGVPAAPSQGPGVQWGEEAGGWRLGVAVSRRTFDVGEPIIVRAQTRNTSGQVRRAPVFAFTAATWGIEVTNLDHPEAMPYTREGQRMYGLDHARPRGGSVSLLRMEPGESVSDLIWVNRVRDMTLWGKYSVQITRRLSTESGDWVTVSAPPLEVEVKRAQYPDDALPQVLALEPAPVYREQAAVAFGASLRRLADELGSLAEREQPADTRHTAHAEFAKLCAHFQGLAEKEAAPAGVSERAAPEPSEPTTAGRATEGRAAPFATTYDLFAKKVLITGEAGRDRLIGQYINCTVRGEGWVASATQEGDGWILKVKADQTVPGQPPITLAVLPKDAQGKAMPTVGEKVSFAGRLNKAEVWGDCVLVTLIEANVAPAVDK